MNNKVFLLGLAFTISGIASAQDIYQMESFSKEDLAGTARYVGMGGAMSALGADLTVMGTNPAGIGLYRHSDVAGSLSINTQEDAQKFDNKGKTHVSFDNLGFVYTSKLNGPTCRFVNFGFNYHKQKNFNMLINTGMNNIPGAASQTWQMADLATYWQGPTKATPLTNAGYETYLIGSNSNGGYDAYGASSNEYHKAQWGSLQAYDFNISTNLSDQFYLGLTIGAYNIDFNSYSIYRENVMNSNNVASGSYTLTNNRDISGNGFNVKAGIIVRPITDSPFRLGFAVSTPTYFNLKMKTTSYLNTLYTDKTPNETYNYNTDVDGFEYNIHTPWKFNFSLGHTIANCLAIGAEYEYADYSTAKITYDDRSNDYDNWGDGVEDHELSNEANQHLKGVSTFKLGAEWYVVDNLVIRGGYNYVSSPFKDSAFKNEFINSASLDYSTSTDYMNLSAINRYTVGLGMTFGKWYVDAACQYQKQHGDFYAFSTQNGNSNAKNDIAPSRIKLDKTQFLFTVGYRF